MKIECASADLFQEGSASLCTGSTRADGLRCVFGCSDGGRDYQLHWLWVQLPTWDQRTIFTGRSVPPSSSIKQPRSKIHVKC